VISDDFDVFHNKSIEGTSPIKDIKQETDKEISGNLEIYNGCQVIGSNIGKPIEVKDGNCFVSPNRQHRAVIKLVTSRSVRYLNFRGEEITCFLGEKCSFGWPNSPDFSLSVSQISLSTSAPKSCDFLPPKCSKNLG
jgi:hypothetical protein